MPFFLRIESRLVPTYCCLIDEAELDDGLPWYYDIYQFLRLDIYPEVATTKDKESIEIVSHLVCDLWGDIVQTIS